MVNHNECKIGSLSHFYIAVHIISTLSFTFCQEYLRNFWFHKYFVNQSQTRQLETNLCSCKKESAVVTRLNAHDAQHRRSNSSVTKSNKTQINYNIAENFLSTAERHRYISCLLYTSPSPRD